MSGTGTPDEIEDSGRPGQEEQGSPWAAPRRRSRGAGHPRREDVPPPAAAAPPPSGTPQPRWQRAAPPAVRATAARLDRTARSTCKGPCATTCPCGSRGRWRRKRNRPDETRWVGRPDVARWPWHATPPRQGCGPGRRRPVWWHGGPDATGRRAERRKGAQSACHMAIVNHGQTPPRPNTIRGRNAHAPTLHPPAPARPWRPLRVAAPAPPP